MILPEPVGEDPMNSAFLRLDPAAPGDQAMTPKKRIMIIEDDQDMIDLLSLILKRGGYDPIPAMGGREGLHLLRKTGADLVLLDLMMDDLNGWAVLRAIKEDHYLRAIPVLIVSARHQMEDPRSTARHAGLFEGYLVKPFIVHDLLTQIREVLQ